ncbi:glycosyltransferase family 4 protein [Pelagibacterium xiamenense]|uniref:glycosyltransferase family 4 protein n=1 Tax=Pelagibacterium xiamenense TaxID=2901140 RepID=UPI001E2D4053|nr:glycosyltransferase family 1 protein [Pelagibacterium xiamenense]MCD7060333.1 glycosyltransferase family 1 protein [Pelagibacterium xiamenense]
MGGEHRAKPALVQEFEGDGAILATGRASTEAIRSVLLVTDAWHPQVNGVVRSLERLRENLWERGLTVNVLSPEGFWTVPMPSYGEIRLCLVNPRNVRKSIEALRPDTIHIATEGPLGGHVRRLCIKKGLPFSTSYHTQFPEYIRARLPVPLGWSYSYLRWFHEAADVCLVPTQTVADRLAARGIANTVIWSRGVDARLFNPDKRTDLGLEGPIFLYVGRVAVEKSVEDFLALDLPGTKVIVGDGPSRARLEREYPDAVFTGHLRGVELARYFASADVFVFPSRTDTFGLVLLEALASGTPVAAYPVPGPLDVVAESGTGVLSEDLRHAALAALAIPRRVCRAYASGFSWEESSAQFLAQMPVIDWASRDVRAAGKVLTGR